MRCALKYGKAFTTTDISGIIFTPPPGHAKLTTWEYIPNGFFLTPFLLGFKNYMHSMECESFVHKTRKMLMKNQPHLYLWGLALDPENKSKRIGKALLQKVLSNAEELKVPVYFETHDDNNVEYYKKYKFELIDMTIIPKHNLKFWCLLQQ